jgi:hypothetical protein
MPTFIHGKDTNVLLDEFDLSAYFNSVDVSTSTDTAETTAFGSTSKSYIVGLADATLSLSGMFAQDADGSDEELQAILGSATTPLVSVLLNAGTIGNRAVVAKAHETNYAISSPVADIVTVTADFNASTDGTANLTYGLRTGVQLTTGASIAYGSLGDLASSDGGASSANGGMANLHVTANTVDDAVVIKVQDSADDATFADLITFSSVSATTKTSEQKAVTGTVARYLRVTASSASATTGSITFNVVFARY